LEKTFTIWDSKVIELPWYVWSTEETAKPYIEWGKDTSIIRAVLRGLLSSDVAAAGSELRMNDSSVNRSYWSVGEAGKTKSFTEDVTRLLLNGLNVFIMKYWKEAYNLLGCKLTVTVTLTVEFEGKPPEEKTEKEKWEEYALYGLTGVALVMGGYIGAKEIESRRAKK
jgi:hypothetical protein